mgnify:FL=1
MNRRYFLKATPFIAMAPYGTFAQTSFPDKPIKTISPYAAGGGPDVQLRQVAPYLGDIFKQSIITIKYNKAW